jgi:hypothetical protein
MQLTGTIDFSKRAIRSMRMTLRHSRPNWQPANQVNYRGQQEELI